MGRKIKRISYHTITKHYKGQRTIGYQGEVKSTDKSNYHSWRLKCINVKKDIEQVVLQGNNLNRKLGWVVF